MSTGHAGQRNATRIGMAVWGIALIVTGLIFAVAWLWVLRSLIVTGSAWSLEARDWLRGGRFSPNLFFVVTPVLAVFFFRFGYDLLVVDKSDDRRPSDGRPGDQTDEQTDDLWPT